MPAAGGECLYLPQNGCAWGVSVCSPTNFKLDQPVSKGALGLGYQAGRGSVLLCLGALVNMRCLWDECGGVCSEPQAGAAGEWETCGAGMGLGCRQGCWVGSGVVLVLEGSVNARVLMNPESVMCVPALVTLASASPRGGNLAVCILHEPYLWVLLKAASYLKEVATPLTFLNNLLPFQTAGGISDLCM